MDIKEIKRSYKSSKKQLKKEYKAQLSEYEAHRRTLSNKEPPKDPPKRHLLEEIGNAVTHGAGSVFSIVAYVLMLLSSDRDAEYLSATIYFVGMLFMFTMSCLYHAFAHGSAVKRLFRRFDYTGIYLLIGATFSPPLLAFIGGTFGTVFSIVQWSVIAVGIVFVAVFGPTKFRGLHIPLYVVLGWSALLLMPSLIKGSFSLAMWILGGGIAYTLGIIPFMMKSKISHFVWHFFVLAGAVIQWVGIYLYIFLP